MKTLTKEEVERMTPEQAAYSTGEAADYETELILIEKIHSYLTGKRALGLSLGENGVPKWYLHPRYKGMKKEKILECITNAEIRKKEQVTRVLDLKADTEILNSIKKSLYCRGLKPAFNESWEVHGPYPGMDYTIYTGYADNIPPEDAVCICPKGSDDPNCPIHGFVCVAIYPRGVYEIEESDKWRDVKSEDRIPIIEKK